MKEKIIKLASLVLVAISYFAVGYIAGKQNFVKEEEVKQCISSKALEGCQTAAMQMMKEEEECSYNLNRLKEITVKCLTVLRTNNIPMSILGEE